MKRALPGILLAAAATWFWPGETPLREIWKEAWSPGRAAGTSSVPAAPDDFRDSEIPRESVLSIDTLPVPDPFGTPPVREPAPRSAPRTDLGVPPPPRPWKATGRVGERAAVLSNPDGRVLVVGSGSKVDSASVVSIGTDGVVLEDRAGRFVIKLP